MVSTSGFWRFRLGRPRRIFWGTPKCWKLRRSAILCSFLHKFFLPFLNNERRRRRRRRRRRLTWSTSDGPTEFPFSKSNNRSHTKELCMRPPPPPLFPSHTQIDTHTDRGTDGRKNYMTSTVCVCEREPTCTCIFIYLPSFKMCT